MTSNSTALILSTNAPSAATNDIRGIKSPVAIPNAWTWLWWVLGALALAALGWALWRRWRKKRAASQTAAPVIPAHQRALEKLREALVLLSQPRPFCIAVSDTVRLYLEERFDLRAPERTTEEFLDELQTSALLAFEHKQTLGEFLSRCDLVKFARYEPTEVELRGLYDAAVRLIEETRPALALAPDTNPNAGANGDATATAANETSGP